MTEIIFIVVKPKTKNKYIQNDPQSCANNLALNQKNRIVQLIRETDPVVHRQIRKLQQNVYVFVENCKRFYLYSKRRNISTNYLKQKKWHRFKRKKANKTINTQLKVDLNDQIARVQTEIVNEIVNFPKQQKGCIQIRNQTGFQK